MVGWGIVRQRCIVVVLVAAILSGYATSGRSDDCHQRRSLGFLYGFVATYPNRIQTVISGPSSFSPAKTSRGATGT
jgi:hypothetical protein